MTTVVITLGKEDERFIESAIKQGRYFSRSELISEGIAELRLRENVRTEVLGELRTAVRVGIEQADRGDFVDFTAEDIIAEGWAHQAQA